MTNLQKSEEGGSGRSPRDKAWRTPTWGRPVSLPNIFPGALGIFLFPPPSIPPGNHYQGKSSFLHCLLQRILAQEKGNGKWLWAILFVSWKVDIPAGLVSASLIGIGVLQPCLASQVDYRPLALS